MAAPIADSATIQIRKPDDYFSDSVPIDSSGRFFIYGLQPDEYRISLRFEWGGRYVYVPWESPSNPGKPQLITVESGRTTEDVDFQVGLESGFARVQVFREDGYAMPYAIVSLLDAKTLRLVQQIQSTFDGIFEFAVPHGEFLVRVQDPTQAMREQFYDRVYSMENAEPINLEAGELTILPDVHMTAEIPTAVSLSDTQPQDSRGKDKHAAAATVLLLTVSAAMITYSKRKRHT